MNTPSFGAGPESKGFERPRVADQIFRDLKEQIVRGALPSGTKLPAERQLALQYKVSGPTVREAIRALSLLGLVDVRHGSGAYVTTDTGALIAMSIGTVIRLGKLGVSDVLGLLGVLNRHAASLAAQSATSDDIRRLEQALAEVDEISDAATFSAAVREFHAAILAAGHNPLVEALCRFLVDLQISIALELVGDTPDDLRLVLDGVRTRRVELVAAIGSGNPETAAAAATNFHIGASQLIEALPQTREFRLSDPKLGNLMTDLTGRDYSS